MNGQISLIVPNFGWYFWSISNIISTEYGFVFKFLFLFWVFGGFGPLNLIFEKSRGFDDELASEFLEVDDTISYLNLKSTIFLCWNWLYVLIFCHYVKDFKRLFWSLMNQVK